MMFGFHLNYLYVQMENSPNCRMYKDLAWTWRIISPPEEYEEEASQFVKAIEAHTKILVKTLLDLGSGGGHKINLSTLEIIYFSRE